MGLQQPEPAAGICLNGRAVFPCKGPVYNAPGYPMAD